MAKTFTHGFDDKGKPVIKEEKKNPRHLRDHNEYSEGTKKEGPLSRLAGRKHAKAMQELHRKRYGGK